jgi:predicted aldo/keto reductase-like oxidoreductase
MRKGKRINRRNFLITATAAGLTPSVAVAANAIFEPNTPSYAAQTGQTAAAAQSPTLQVPVRELGKTGAKISCLSIGGDFSFLDKQIVLRKAVEWGVTCWDTAYNYGRGNAEIGFGQFISQNPDARAKLFLVSKASIMWGTVTLMQNEQMQEALEACNKAGVGVIAMKTLSAGIGRLQGIETEEDQKLAGHFVEKGFTEGQAKIKAVLQDTRIASACVGMGSVSILSSNVAAALDKTALSDTDMAGLQDYARATRSGYCAGCSQICDAALGRQSPINDVMRYLMYFNCYGDKDRARTLFGQLPSDVRERLLATDYSPAELRCPQRMPIGDCMAEAVGKLA